MFEELERLMEEILSKDMRILVSGLVLMTVGILCLSIVLMYYRYNKYHKEPYEKSKGAGWIRNCILLCLLTLVFPLATGMSNWVTTVLFVLSIIFSGLIWLHSLYGVIGLMAVSGLNLIMYYIYVVRIVIHDWTGMSSFGIASRVPVMTAINVLITSLILLQILTMIFYVQAMKVVAMTSSKEDEKEEDHPIEDALQDGKKAILGIFIGSLLLAPTFLINITSYLTGDYYDLVNQYAEPLSQYLNDFSVYDNAQWQEAYEAGKYELLVYDYRPFGVKSSRLSQSDLFYVESFGQASLSEIYAVNQIDEAMKQRDEDAVLEYTGIFYNSYLIKNNSNIVQLGRITNSSDTIFIKFYRIVVDAVRFYTSYVPMWLIGSLLIVLSGVLGYFQVRQLKTSNQTIRMMIGSPIPQNMLSTTKLWSWLNIAGTVFTVLVLFSYAFMTSIVNPEDYASLVGNAITTTGGTVMSDLVSEQSSNQIQYSIGSQIIAIDAMIENDEHSDNEEFVVIVDELRAQLVSLANTLDAGEQITDEQISSYMSIEMEALQEALPIILESTYSSIGDIMP